MHVGEYGQAIVNPFIAETLAAIHQEVAAHLAHHPHTVFDITEPERARHCFYMIRNLIRRNDRTLDDELRLLLQIPAVRALAHQEIGQGMPNELLRLAQSTGNGVAAEMLLTIDAVRSLAAAHDFYRAESHRGIDIRQLARDRESSMTALTAGESRRLDAAQLNPPSASKAELSAPAATQEDSAASQTHSTAAYSQRSLWLNAIGFQAQLNVLEAKTKQMATQGVNYANAYQTAHKLITQLKKAEEDFTHGQNEVRQDKKAFRSACLAAIRQASPELQKHWVWKDILSKVASVFISVISFGVANVITGYSLCGLFPTKTDAAVKLEALNRVINTVSL